MARKLWERLGNDGVQSLPESSSELIDNFSIKWEICGRTCDSSRKISIANECSQNWRTHFQMRNEHLGWIWKPSLISDWILMTLDSSTTWSQISNIRGCTKYNLTCVWLISTWLSVTICRIFDSTALLATELSSHQVSSKINTSRSPAPW